MSRERQKLYVERQKNGLAVLPVVVFEVGIVEMLEIDGYLSACCDHTRHEEAEALSKWLHATMMTRHNMASDPPP